VRVAIAVLAASCRFGFDEVALVTRDAGVDAFDQCASELVDLGPWGTPTEVPGINAAQNDDDPAPRHDGLELIWSSNRAGGAGMSDLYRVTRASTSDNWGAVERILELATVSNENTPGLSSDGLEMLFSSNRAGSQMEDVWATTRATLDSPWEPPIRVPELSSASLDRGPSLWNNDLSLVMHSNRSGSEDLYVAFRPTRTSPWSTPTLLVPPTTGGNELRGWVSPCGLEITFQSSSRGVGDTTFYVMTRASVAEPFGNEREMPELNSPAYEEDLQILPNRRHAYFSTDREGGAGEIYESFR